MSVQTGCFAPTMASVFNANATMTVAVLHSSVASMTEPALLLLIVNKMQIATH